MIMAGETKINLPQLPSTVWWKLRSKFQQTVPQKITDSYLASVLSVEPSAAKAYLRELRGLGLVQEDGTPTERAFHWREDATYATACSEIIENAYPQELREVAPPPKPDKTAVVSWMKRAARLGEGAAKNKAATYLLIAQGDPDERTEQPARSNKQSKDKAKATRPTRSPATSVKRAVEAESEPKKERPERSNLTIQPAVNINIQIHISPESSAEQIEAIFRSMSMHLRET